MNDPAGLLRCPFCLGSLEPSTDLSVSRYGLMACGCRRYPVVEGIPIIKTGVVGSDGETCDDIVRLIEQRRHRDALLGVLVPPPPAAPALAPAWLRHAPPVKGLWRLTHSLHTRRLPRWRRQMIARLLTPSLTAQDFFDLYFRRSGNRKEGYNYFLFRHGMPRHLVALSMMTLVPAGKGPALDLACGFGHLTRSLVRHNRPGMTIGVDRVFFCLYVAARLIAPDGRYVCTDLEQTLPFDTGIFTTILCSDAFHYFRAKAELVQAMVRSLVPDGVLLITSMRNSAVPQLHSCLSLSPRGYAALVDDMPYRLVSDRAILDRYLKRLGPPLRRSESWETLETSELMSLVVSRDTHLFCDHGPFRDWPHAVGRLSLNPLYRAESLNGTVRLHRVFPSEFYEKENHDCKDYLPETVDVSPRVWEALRQGVSSGRMDDLIACCVALDMPERYLSPLS